MRVYNTRKSAQSTIVLNENDLVEKLISLDFDVIDMSSLSIREQFFVFLNQYCSLSTWSRSD